MKFNEYVNLKDQLIVTESADHDVNLHLTHLEDLAIEQGKEGFVNFENHVVNLLKFLSGLTTHSNLSVKIDGSPAIFFGHDPREDFKGQFFVATKSAFNVGVPKINHSEAEIDQYYDGELAAKLKETFASLQRCYDNSGLVYQGDLLFSRPSDKQLTNIDGIDYLTFKPNTVVYAVPVDNKSGLFERINKANVGIILHGCYKCTSLDGKTVKAVPVRGNFDKIKEAGKHEQVFIEDPNYNTLNINVSSETRLAINSYLTQCSEHINELSRSFDREWKTGEVIGLLKMYMNHQIRTDGGIFKRALKREEFEVDTFKRAFKKWISQRFENEMGKRKSEPGKISVLSRRDQNLKWIEANAHYFDHLLRATYCMILIKNEILKLVGEIEYKLGKAFYQMPDGSFRASKGEGFVQIINNNRVKIVDRLDFSAQNFARTK